MVLLTAGYQWQRHNLEVWVNESPFGIASLRMSVFILVVSTVHKK